MRPERAFVAERVAAQHCAELLRRGPEPGELLPLFARAGERFARQLAQGLAALSGGDLPSVDCKPVREADMAELTRQIAPLAANSLLGAGVSGAPLLASLQADAVLRMVDKAFGGKGEAPGHRHPAESPSSSGRNRNHRWNRRMGCRRYRVSMKMVSDLGIETPPVSMPSFAIARSGAQRASCGGSNLYVEG